MVSIKAIEIARNTLAGIKYAWNNRHIYQKTMELRLQNQGLGKNVAGMIAKVVKGFPGILAVAGLAVALGIAGSIWSMSKRKGEKGGAIGGKRHSEGGTFLEAEQGEFLMSRKGVSNVGLGNLYNMNEGGGIAGGKGEEGGEVGAGSNAPVQEERILNVQANPYEIFNAPYQDKLSTMHSKFMEV
jgi:hypothetical protein